MPTLPLLVLAVLGPAFALGCGEEPEEIDPPEEARPFEEIVDQLPLEPSGLGEFLSARRAEKRGPTVTAKCEGLGPGPDWRRQGVEAGRFGLLGPSDLSSAVELRNGNFVAKRGAVVVGHAPVTVRVPGAAQGRVGLVYGDASRGRGRRLSEAPVGVTFRPCSNRPRSGYVGGLLLETVKEPVTLAVQLSDSRTERLTIQPGM